MGMGDLGWAGGMTRRVERPRRAQLGRLVVWAALTSALIAGQPAAWAQSEGDEAEIPAARLVILADESGSLSAADVAAEADAVRILALSVFSGDSEIAVLGFGSSNRAGQNAVSEYCLLTPVGTETGRRLVTACADRIHPRTANEGNDTDHAAALDAALDLLEQPDAANRRRIIFLLTDGELDVRNSPQYGAVGTRNQAALEEIEDELLPRASAANVQIWPLGYGDADLQALQAFALGASGADERCADRIGTQPTAVVVEDTAQVVDAFLAALAAAQCGVLIDSPAIEIGPGETVERIITIPTVATDVTITANKGDDRITVTYVDPNGNVAPELGEAEGQIFELAGGGGPVEALRIRDPIPGDWTIRFTAPGDITGKLVRAQALWIGAVTALIGVDPQVPRPGDELTAELRLRTRREVVTDPADLAGLRFSAQVRLEGQEPADVPLNDEGTDGDLFAGDGAFSGIVVIPEDFAGAGEIVGKVEGAGLLPDIRPIGFNVDPLEPVFDAELEIEMPAQIELGGTVAGTVSVVNEAEPMQIRVGISDASHGANVTIEPSTFSVPTGVSTVDFLLTVGTATPTGQLSFNLNVRSLPDQTVRESRFISSEVAIPPPPPPPPPPPSFPWWIVGLVGGLAALIAAVVIGKLAGESRRKWSVAGLIIELYGIEGDLTHSLPIPRNAEKESWFVVTDPYHPTLQEARPTTAGSLKLRWHAPRTQVVVNGSSFDSGPIRLGEDLPIPSPDSERPLRIRVIEPTRRRPAARKPGSSRDRTKLPGPTKGETPPPGNGFDSW